MLLSQVKEMYNSKQIDLLKKYGFNESSNYLKCSLANAYDKMYEQRFNNSDYFQFRELK